MIRMGHYESFEFEGTISIDTRLDEEVKGFDDGRAGEYLANALDEMFKDDINEARLTTANDDSYIHLYQVEDSKTDSTTN